MNHTESHQNPRLLRVPLQDSTEQQRANPHRTQGDTGAKFRASIVLRLGEDRVAEIDNDNTIHRWTIDECREIRNKYKALVKDSGN